MTLPIVAGSTYLLAPPPTVQSSSPRLLSSLLCLPLSHTHQSSQNLLLQLQRKDPASARLIVPQFDLVLRKSSRGQILPRKGGVEETGPSPPREVAVLDSETGRRLALVKYLRYLSSTTRKRFGISEGDDSVIATMSWHCKPSVTKEVSIHRYSAKRRIGYEFRVQCSNGVIISRWTKRVALPPPPVQERPHSVMQLASGRSRRSSSVSSGEVPNRRYTVPTMSPPQTTPEPKWEFRCAALPRVAATMTSRKLVVLPISSTTPTPQLCSSPPTSDFDEETPSAERYFPFGQVVEFAVLTGMFVALEQDFATLLRHEFINTVSRRTPTVDVLDPIESPARTSSRRGREPALPAREPIPDRPPPRTPIPLTKIDSKVHDRVPVERTMSNALLPGYASRGWGYMTSAATVCVTKLMSLAA
jgi:hypothetical protein